MSASGGQCPSGHVMTPWTDSEFEGMYTCNVCSAPSAENDAGLECKLCRYNKCLSCVGSQSQATCPKGHPLARMALSQLAVCDKCKGANPCPSQLVCKECDYVFCHRCLFALATSSAVPAPYQSEFSNVFVPPVKPSYGDPTAGFDDEEMRETPATGLYWYKAQKQGAFFVTDSDCTWLFQRPTRQIYFQDGLLADVSSTQGCKFEISQYSLIPDGEVIYFTLPEWFPSAENAQTVMGEYAPFPAEFIPGKDFGIDGTGYGNNGYSDYGNSHLDLWKNRESDRSVKSNVRILVSNLVTCMISVLALWINFVICEAIGRDARHWAFVFLWLFLGNLAYIAVYTFICWIILRYGGGKHRHNPILKTVGLCILMFVFTCSFGAPIAWTQAQQTVADRYLANDKLKTLNCWRNPNEHFDQINDNFIVFEEADWIVDYKLRYNQGVSTLVGTGDDDQDDGKRFNFCLAPMTYRGLPDCPQNFYAACYRETSMSYLASCDDSDARTCGWDLPSPGNLIRTMNRNEQFWSGVEEEDEQLWRNALPFATPSSSQTPVSSLIGFYSGEGPTEITEYQDKAENLEYALLVSGLCVFSGLMVVFMLLATFCGDDD